MPVSSGRRCRRHPVSSRLPPMSSDHPGVPLPLDLILRPDTPSQPSDTWCSRILTTPKTAPGCPSFGTPFISADTRARSLQRRPLHVRTKSDVKMQMAASAAAGAAGVAPPSPAAAASRLPPSPLGRLPQAASPPRSPGRNWFSLGFPLTALQRFSTLICFSGMLSLLRSIWVWGC